MLVEFCREHDVRHEICGKVVVATSDEEVPRLEELLRRGTANGVPDLEHPPRARELRSLGYRMVRESFAR
jgi:L-2-hydroxyglutarate oxidase LhgO